MDSGFEATTREIISHHVRHDYLNDTGAEALWKNSPDVPTSDELRFIPKDELLQNDVNRSSWAREEYLETQYRLCRAEGTDLLRQAIARFRKNPDGLDGRDGYVYTKVRLEGYTLSRLCLGARVSFSTERSPGPINWKESSRLINGTIVVLSPKEDAFASKCFVATVKARPIVGGLVPAPWEEADTPPRVDILWANYAECVIDPSVEMIMLEAGGGFYEGVKNCMVGLQHAALQPSKFDKYILDGAKDGLEPQYLRSTDIDIPDIADEFDQSQREAFNRMTTQELAIVQGPPGTGKTFTSVVALESLTRTLSKLDRSYPVIVSAQTNHALDQILAACMGQFDAQIARVGGRTEDKSIEKRTLFNLREDSKLPYGEESKTRSEAMKRWKTSGARIQERLRDCFPLDSQQLISPETFRKEGLLDQKQYESLVNPSHQCVAANQGDKFEEKDASIKRWLEMNAKKEKARECQPKKGDQKAKGKASPGTTFDQRLLPEDDEIERLKGEFVSLRSSPGFSSGSNSYSLRAAKQLQGRSDLYDIKPNLRSLVYKYLSQKLVQKVKEEFPQLLREYESICTDLAIAKYERTIKVLRFEGVQIIGCTTTGLTKYRGFLSAMKPKVLLIEEAAETREANITSALFPSLDQLILVGDHQQLAPQADVKRLESKLYNFTISLFQRLVDLGVPYTRLSTQRRMIPAISEVIQDFYPNLEDHHTVKDPDVRPPVPGMDGCNNWWFDHNWQESRGSVSYSNFDEAKMLLGFMKYLIQNGMKPTEITILTYYRSQLEYIQTTLKADKFFNHHKPQKDWSVRTVDSFQGEQNEVILLSLVRSRDRSEAPAAGFVENENRAVVALSRAKRGLYVFGNARNILWSTPVSIETWESVLQTFKRQGRITSSLPVTCQSHGNVSTLSSPADWIQVPEGGCGKPCQTKLPCGHLCDSICRQKCKCSQKCDWMKQQQDQQRLESLHSRHGSRSYDSGEPGYVTSDEIMEAGFRNRFGSRITEDNSQVPDWSAASVISKDREHALSISKRSITSPSKIQVEQTYIRTQTTEDGQRVVDGKFKETYSLRGPAPSLKLEAIPLIDFGIEPQCEVTPSWAGQATDTEIPDLL